MCITLLHIAYVCQYAFEFGTERRDFEARGNVNLEETIYDDLFSVFDIFHRYHAVRNSENGAMVFFLRDEPENSEVKCWKGVIVSRIENIGDQCQYRQKLPGICSVHIPKPSIIQKILVFILQDAGSRCKKNFRIFVCRNIKQLFQIK